MLQPRSLLIALATSFIPTTGHTQTAFSPDARPALHETMNHQDRVFHQIHAAPFGIGLDFQITSPEVVSEVQAFALGTGTVKEEIGKHPFSLVAGYSGPSGIGLRGGGSAFATAFRYRALRQEGANAEILEQARQDVIRAINTLHVVVAITGEPGRVARGVQRLKPENPTAPPIPLADLREPIPLFDTDGNPLPPEKNNGTPRADNSQGKLPAGEWSWEDSCSKDQLIGWVTAMGALYDAAKNDPDIDQGLLERMAEDASAIGGMLREKHEFEVIGGPPEHFDLVIMDADGRPTKHHDLNPSGVDGIWFSPSAGPVNPLNLLMAMGILKTLHHVSGDPVLEEYLYTELLSDRNWLTAIPDDPIDAGLYAGTGTNFSVVNMAALGIYNALHYETDPAVATPLSNWLETVFWAPDGELRGAQHLKQPYFHAIYLMNTASGTAPDLVDETANLLLDYNLGPYQSEFRENCDANELESGVCVAIDGTTELTIAQGLNWHDEAVADSALPPSLRPTSNFDARSDPFRVNGGGSPTSLLPGGDLLSAYWMLRWMQVNTAGTRTMSLNAREHMAVGGTLRDARANDEGATDTSADVSEANASGPMNDLGVQDISAEVLDSRASRISQENGGCTSGDFPRNTSSPLLAIGLLNILLMLRFTRRRQPSTRFADTVVTKDVHMHRV